MSIAALGPTDIVQHMEVPGEPGVFVLGALERRVTLYSQQVRALNLIYALFEQGRLRQGDKVAVVGGGGAGITAAAGASLKGCKVSLLEQMKTLLPLFQGNQTRWLHPHIYDWPEVGSENDQAGLPVLNWRAGLAGEVARQILAEFDALSSRFGVQMHYDIRDLNIQPDQSKGCLLSWNTTRFHRSGSLLLSLRLVLVLSGIWMVSSIPHTGIVTISINHYAIRILPCDVILFQELATGGS